MAGLGKTIAGQQEAPGGLAGALQGLWDEATGAFARYGRRSGAQRDASLALLNQAVDPNTDPLTGAGQKLLGLAGLITHPLAFFPTGDEWRQRLAAAGNTSRLGQSIGGMLGDLPSIVDPHLLAGGGVLAAAPLVGKLGKGRGLSDLMGDATDAELAALKARLETEAAQMGGAASATTREEALKNLTEAVTPKEFRTQSYKTVAEDGTTQWVPGTLRANPSSVPRFESSMSLADIKRYIDQYGEAPKPRDKTELVTQSYKEVYPDGTVKFAPGTLRTKRFAAPVDDGALAMAPLASKLINKADDAGIIAYHGSPHYFDKFDMSKIGTGEGAQAYGHGLYFAENEGVADGYRKTLGGKGMDVGAIVAKHYPDAPLSEEATAAIYRAAVNGKPDPKDAAKSVQMQVRDLRDDGQSFLGAPGEKGQKLAAAISDIRDIQKGSMYQVRIDASPDELLDWDRPLSEQPEVWSKISGESRLQSQQAILADGDRLVTYAQKAEVPTLVGVKVQSELRKGASLEDAFANVRKLGGSIQDAEKSAKWTADVDKLKAAIGSGDVTLKGTVPGDWTGARIAKDVPGMKPDEIAETLKARGVKGIRYKDQGSRGTDGGTYNYVIFDDKLITILKKYGIPMTAGAGGAMMVAGQDMPPEFAAQMGGT